MPRVSIQILAPLSGRLGLAHGGTRAVLEQDIEPGATVRDVLSRLGERYPSFRENALEPETVLLLPHILLLVDGRYPPPDAYDVPLEDGAEIVLLPAYAGG